MNFNNFYIEMDQNFVWKMLLFFCAICIIIASSDTAFAAAPIGTADVIGSNLCRLVDTLSGNTAKAVATIAIFVLGVGLFLGKFNWPAALTVVVGVVIVFSAGKFVTMFAGSGSSACMQN